MLCFLSLGAANRYARGDEFNRFEAPLGTTIDAVWECFQKECLVSIEPGKPADIAILYTNPPGVPGGISDIEALEVIIEGKPMYRRWSK